MKRRYGCKKEEKECRREGCSHVDLAGEFHIHISSCSFPKRPEHSTWALLPLALCRSWPSHILPEPRCHQHRVGSSECSLLSLKRLSHILQVIPSVWWQLVEQGISIVTQEVSESTFSNVCVLELVTLKRHLGSIPIPKHPVERLDVEGPGFGWGKSAAELFNGLCLGSGSEIVVERNNCRTNKVVLVATVPSHLICLGERIVSAFGCSELSVITSRGIIPSILCSKIWESDAESVTFRRVTAPAVLCSVTSNRTDVAHGYV